MELLDRLGGAQAVARLTDSLYDRLLVDPEIGPLFAETHMPAQRVRLAEYLTAACVGDEAVSAERLRSAHRQKGVNDRHFSILAGYLADLLAESAVDPDAAADFLDLIAARRADVVSDSAVATSWEPIDPTV